MMEMETTTASGRRIRVAFDVVGEHVPASWWAPAEVPEVHVESAVDIETGVDVDLTDDDLDHIACEALDLERD